MSKRDPKYRMAQKEITDLRSFVSWLRTNIDNDAPAASFQSMGQYRTALRNNIDQYMLDRYDFEGTKLIYKGATDARQV